MLLAIDDGVLGLGNAQHLLCFWDTVTMPLAKAMANIQGAKEAKTVTRKTLSILSRLDCKPEAHHLYESLCTYLEAELSAHRSGVLLHDIQNIWNKRNKWVLAFFRDKCLS